MSMASWAATMTGDKPEDIKNKFARRGTHSTILVVQNGPTDAISLQDLANKEEGLPFSLEGADSLSKAAQRLTRGDVKMMLVDLGLLVEEKVIFLAKLLDEVPAGPIVVLAAHEDLGPVVRSLQRDILSRLKASADLATEALGSPGTRSPEFTSAAWKGMLGRATISWYSQRLLSSEARFRRIIEKSSDAIAIVDATGIVRYANSAMEKLFGKKVDEIVGQRFAFPVTAGDTTEVDIIFGKVKSIAEMRVVEIEWLEQPAYLASLRDITEHKRLEAELHALSQRLVDAQEEERRFVAAELHDQVGQYITGLRLSMDMLERLPEKKVKTKLRETRTLLDELMMQVRNLSLELRPAMLDDLGILPTFLWYFERYASQTGVRVAFTHNHLEMPMPRHVKIAAFRIVQEALTNVARHAHVNEAQVKAYANPGILQLEVEDQGVGFDPMKVLTEHPCCGLTGMRERATAVGGKLTIERTPGAGTRVMADLPLFSESDNKEKGETL